MIPADEQIGIHNELVKRNERERVRSNHANQPAKSIDQSANPDHGGDEKHGGERQVQNHWLTTHVENAARSPQGAMRGKRKERATAAGRTQ